MTGSRFKILLCAVVFSVIAAGQSRAASVHIGLGQRIVAPLKSWKDLRDKNLVVQRYDYSCGSAALATLMGYGYGQPIGEREILMAVFETLSGEAETARRDKGLSLLDLQRVAEANGFSAQGFKVAADQLTALKGPVIVFISPGGYDHFAVLKGIRGDRVYLADPSRGNLREPAYRFLDSWLGDDGKGVIFAIQPDGDGGYVNLLASLGEGPTQPELMSARQMLEVGSPFARIPGLRTSAVAP
ncbi:MAG: C39 family peptidase [Alphaproteobacteria bacterium]